MESYSLPAGHFLFVLTHSSAVTPSVGIPQGSATFLHNTSPTEISAEQFRIYRNNMLMTDCHLTRFLIRSMPQVLFWKVFKFGFAVISWLSASILCVTSQREQSFHDLDSVNVYTTVPMGKSIINYSEYRRQSHF